MATYNREIWMLVQGLFEGSPTCSFNCLKSGFRAGHEYEFRVSAVNENGQGPPLNGDRPIVAGLPFGKTT